MEAWDYNHTGNYVYNRIHIEIVGPAGHIANCNEFSGPDNRWDDLTDSPVCKVEYHADVPAGRYCQKTWEWLPVGSRYGWVSLATPACVDVSN